MKPERWQLVRKVFESAELLQGGDLLDYLEAACAGDTELRAEVESLLRAQSRAGSRFMVEPAANLMRTANLAVAEVPRAGLRVGAYQILDEIGHGGMGEVYRAFRVDGQFKQEVAIKLVRIGLGSSFVMERFVHERQILATLNHPNIAHLLDGGTTNDGVPYLVMELIEGERIDAYCREHRLSVTERLQLFLHVCEAVEHAHQRLVIHRDIKPGNILVTKDGTPKLLDFGIAKILDPSGAAETTVTRSMTPEYASPEQISGRPITTATDVYALGMVLYKLLTGCSPYRVPLASPLQWSQAVTHTDPQRPSSAVLSETHAGLDGGFTDEKPAEAVLNTREPTAAKLRRRLSGDLDCILLKALRKEPEKRYGAARQLADDIQRHLDGLPVTALKGSWAYNAGKFVSRHRVPVAATVLVIIALVAGIGATLRQARIARVERARAQKRFDDVRAFSNSLIFDVHDALQDIPGTTAARNLLLDRAVQYLDRVSADSEGDPNLQRELASAYQRLATVQGDATTSNLGQVGASRASYGKATLLFEAVARANPTDTADQLSVAKIYRQRALSNLYHPEGRPDIDKALAITSRLMQTDGQNSKVQIERAADEQILAASLDLSGERSQSADLYRQSLDLVLAVAQHDPAFNSIAERAAKTRVQLGFQLARTPELEEAQKQIEEGIRAYDGVLQQGSRPDAVRDQSASRYRLGYVQALRGDLAGAYATFQLVRDTEAPLLKADPQNLTLKVDLLSVDFELARLLILKDRYREAEAGIERVIAGFHALNAEEDSGPGIGVLLVWLGEAQYRDGRFRQALDSFRKAVQEMEKDSSDDDSVCGIVSGYVKIGDVLMKLGRSADAETAYKSALDRSNPAAAGKYLDLPALIPLRAAHAGMGEVKIASASRPADQAFFDGCKEYARAEESGTLIPTKLEFNPANFPAFPGGTPPKECNRLHAQ